MTDNLTETMKKKTDAELWETINRHNGMAKDHLDVCIAAAHEIKCRMKRRAMRVIE